MTTTKEATVTIRCRPFNRDLSTARRKVDPAGVVRVYDDIAGHYTACHSLTAQEIGRIRAAARRSGVEI